MRRWIFAVTLGLSLPGFGACATLGTRRIDYSALSTADRLEVRTTSGKSIVKIADPTKVRRAVEFILQRQDRWGDRVNPSVPTLVFEFYKGDQPLGGYGAGTDILVALPGERGFWWRDVSEAEVDALLKAVGVSFATR